VGSQLKESQSILHTILSVQPQKSGGGEAKSTDEIVSALAESIGARIIHKINPDDANMHLIKVRISARVDAILLKELY